jgi:hypothetical protein
MECIGEDGKAETGSGVVEGTCRHRAGRLTLVALAVLLTYNALRQIYLFLL